MLELLNIVRDILIESSHPRLYDNRPLHTLDIFLDFEYRDHVGLRLILLEPVLEACQV